MPAHPDIVLLAELCDRLFLVIVYIVLQEHNRRAAALTSGGGLAKLDKTRVDELAGPAHVETSCYCVDWQSIDLH